MRILITNEFDTCYNYDTKSVLCAVVENWFYHFPYEHMKLQKQHNDVVSLQVKGKNYNNGTKINDWTEVYDTVYRPLTNTVLIDIKPAAKVEYEVIMGIL